MDSCTATRCEYLRSPAGDNDRKISAPTGNRVMDSKELESKDWTVPTMTVMKFLAELITCYAAIAILERIAMSSRIVGLLNVFLSESCQLGMG